MKKIIAMFAVLAMFMTLTACHKAPEVVVPEPPIIEEPVVEEPTKETEPTLSVSIEELDAQMKDLFSDGLITAEYLDGIYYVLFTVDGIHDIIGTNEYLDFCGTVGELSETMKTTLDVENVFIFYDDVESEMILYATLDGADITSDLS